jgi:hypothetical protein
MRKKQDAAIVRVAPGARWMDADAIARVDGITGRKLGRL